MEFVILKMSCTPSELKIGSSIEVQYLKIKSVIFKELLSFQRGVKCDTKF